MSDEVYSEIVTFEEAQAIRPILGHLGTGGGRVRHPDPEIAKVLDNVLLEISPRKAKLSDIDAQAALGASRALQRVRNDVDYSALGGCQVVFRTSKEQDIFNDAKYWAQGWGLIE